MRIAAFRGDKNFTDLTPKEKKKAEGALLRANPQLRSFADLQRGALLIVPKMAELQSRTQGETEEPAATVARSIEKALHQYSKHLILASERGVKDAQETVKTLKQRDIKEMFDKHEVLREAVGNVAKAAAEREKESERLHAFATKELEVAQKDLAELIDRLS